jgi:hypothetical protein
MAAVQGLQSDSFGWLGRSSRRSVGEPCLVLVGRSAVVLDQQEEGHGVGKRRVGVGSGDGGQASTQRLVYLETLDDVALEVTPALLLEVRVESVVGAGGLSEQGVAGEIPRESRAAS